MIEPFPARGEGRVSPSPGSTHHELTNLSPRTRPASTPLITRGVVELEEVAHLAQPALLREAQVVRVLVVAVVGGLICELHRNPEAVAVLRTDPGEELERLHARDRREPLGRLEEVPLPRRSLRMGERERHGMPDAPSDHPRSLLPRASHYGAVERISDSVCRGVIASGSTLNSSSAGRSWPRARSSAPGKSFERTTSSP